MDCCNTKQNIKNESKEESMKGGKSMVEVKKNMMLWIVIGILVIATIFLTFRASSIGTGAAQSTASAARTAASTTSSGMVGGC
ncbi:MAG: hypothetical protein Q7S74_04175 [Nanoarchaeota archaeon]|nr:hypothetical protein [Nanoarchaeota archaeon]